MSGHVQLKKLVSQAMLQLIAAEHLTKMHMLNDADTSHLNSIILQSQSGSDYKYGIVISQALELQATI